MRKLLLALILCLASFKMASAQNGQNAILIDLGFQSNYQRLGVGLGAYYFINEHFRFAPDATYYFPSDNIKGLDFNFNLHYLFALDGMTGMYPLVGVAMINNRWSYNNKSSHGDTDFGFNFGLGMERYVSGNTFFKGEIKYSLQDHNNLSLMVGYGINF